MLFEIKSVLTFLNRSLYVYNIILYCIVFKKICFVKNYLGNMCTDKFFNSTDETFPEKVLFCIFHLFSNVE